MRLLLFFALIFIIYYTLKGLLDLPKPKMKKTPRDKKSQDTKSEVVDELVKDPVCGVYVAKSQAIKLKDGVGELFFCSKACKEKYLQKTKRHH